MSCSINFYRRGKLVEVSYVPDDDMKKILEEQEINEIIRRALAQKKAELELLKEVEN